MLPLGLTLLGGCVALLPSALGFPDPPDFVPLGLLWAAAAWGFFAARRRRRGQPRRRALPIVQGVAAAGMTYWMLIFSAYAEASGAARVGDRAPEISAVRVRDGARFDLPAERGQMVLLVFFRGKW